MKIVISSDWHLDAVTDGVRRGPDVEQAVEESVAYAVRERVDVYIMAGDLGDPNTVRIHRAVAYAARVAARLKAQGITVIFITGNHDVVEDGSGDNVMMALEPAGARVMDGPEHVVLHDRRGPSVDLFALPYTPASHGYDPEFVLNDMLLRLQAVRMPQLIVGHLNLAGIVPGSESKQYARGREVFWPLDAIREHAPDALLVGGHYHRRQVYEGVNIVGSLARLTHGEEDHEPGFMTIEVRDGAAPTIVS